MAHASYKNAATKTIEDTVKQSLKRALPQKFFEKKDKKKQFRNDPHYRRSFEFTSISQASAIGSFRSYQHGSKVCFSCGKEGHELDRDWGYLENGNEPIPVIGRLE